MHNPFFILSLNSNWHLFFRIDVSCICMSHCLYQTGRSFLLTYSTQRDGSVGKNSCFLVMIRFRP